MNVLAIGSHPDDIELGCGGTLAKHVAQGDHVTMMVISNGEAGPGDVSERQREAEKAAGVLGCSILFANLPDGRVNVDELSLVHAIERAIASGGIDRVYTHWHVDSHQDHRTVGEATWGAARHTSQVLCYESPSSFGFDPTIFVDITETLDKKLEALGHHASQVESSRMVSTNRVANKAHERGFTARVEAAEAFIAHRMVLNL